MRKGIRVFSSPGPEKDAGKLADAFKLAAETNYGTAGPEFVRRVIKHGALKAGEITRKRANEFVAAQVPAGADGQVVRVARRLGHFAAAGELATELKITLWKMGEDTKAAAWAFQQWLGNRGGTEPAEVRQAIEQVRLFIAQHGDSRFDRVDGSAGPEETRPVQRNILRRASDGFQRVHKIDGKSMRETRSRSANSSSVNSNSITRRAAAITSTPCSANHRSGIWESPRLNGIPPISADFRNRCSVTLRRNQNGGWYARIPQSDASYVSYVNSF